MKDVMLWFEFVLQAAETVKRQPKSQCLSALVSPIFREVKMHNIKLSHPDWSYLC